MSILGISNDLTCKERLDARTLSSFGDKEFVFAPYDATQLREILDERAKEGLLLAIILAWLTLWISLIFVIGWIIILILSPIDAYEQAIMRNRRMGYPT